MSENSSSFEGKDTSVRQINGVSDTSYYEALYQIIQDAQAAGSVVQIVTIWPSSQVSSDGATVLKPLDCKPSGACPK